MNTGLPDLGPRYRVDRELGRGSFGVVYLAYATELEVPCAVKLLHADLRADPKLESTLRREAAAVLAVSSPHVAAWRDYGRSEDGRSFVAFEFCAGETLRQRLARAPLDDAERLAILRQLAEGLGAIHRAGIVHRDLKPGNVMLVPRSEGPPLVKILDFGLARLQTSGRGVGTATTAGMCTPGYAPPEYVRLETRSEAVRPAFDVFSLGAIAYELFTGRRAYSGHTIDEVLLRVVAGAPPRIDEGEDGDSTPRRRIAGLLVQALDPDPARRPSDLAAWVEAVASAWNVRRRPTEARAGMLALMLALLLAAVLFVTLRSDSRGSPGPALRATRCVPTWAEEIEAEPDPRIVTDPTALASLRALDLAWRVRDTKTGIEMLLVPPGSYLRGSPDTEAGRSADEGPQHRVTFTKPFYLGVYEVTNAQYRKHYKADHDSGAYEGHTLNGDEQPVVRVSYIDAMAFCKANGFELPSEAQWEYAARGGTTTVYPWGDDPAAGGGWANACDVTAKRKFPTWSWPAFPWDDAFEVAAPVGRFRANGFGFHDMIGNVWEVLADAYLEKAYSDCAAGVTDPTFIVGDSRSVRVWRGGSW